MEKNLNTNRRNSLFLVLFSLCVFEMDTNTYSHGNQNIQSVAQRKFYQWVLKWINGMNTYSDSNGEEIRDIQQSAKPDVRILAGFLQAIGFKLLSFEKHDGFVQKKTENNSSTLEQGILRVMIECDISNMRAVLELEGITCRCPNPDHIKDASFWSISGTGPIGSTDNIVQKIEETGSNLLPPLSKDVARVLRDVSYKLFDTIAYEPDVNSNTDASLNVLKKEIGVTRSRTQPEMRLRADNINSKSLSENYGKNTNVEASLIRNVSPINSNNSGLQRQKTWDLDIEIQNLDEEPRPSPPKLASSPAVIAELSNSLGQISLQSDIDNSRNITEYIMGAQQNLEKALKMLLTKKPMILNDLSPNLDQDSASVKSAPSKISPTVTSPFGLTRTNTMDIKFLPKQNNLTHDYQLSTKSNVAQIPKARRSIEPILSKSGSRKSEQDNMKLTARRSSFYIPSPANSNISLLSKSEAKQKLLGIGKYSTSKTSIIQSDISNRTSLTKRVASPEPRIGATPNLETLNVSNGRASLIKPPTKISKSIPVKINKPVQTSKINTGIIKKTRTNLSKD